MSNPCPVCGRRRMTTDERRYQTLDDQVRAIRQAIAVGQDPHAVELRIAADIGREEAESRAAGKGKT